MINRIIYEDGRNYICEDCRKIERFKSILAAGHLARLQALLLPPLRTQTPPHGAFRLARLIPHIINLLPECTPMKQLNPPVAPGYSASTTLNSNSQ